MFPYMEAAGAVIGLFGARSQRKAARRQAAAIERAARIKAETMREIAAPWTEAGKEGLEKFRYGITNLLAPEVDKEDPYLAAEHRENLTGIERERERELAKSRSYWKPSGNVGRGRGEELRIGQAAQEAKNRENLLYGRGQQETKERGRNRYLSALSSLVGMGQTGIQPLLGSAESEYEGTVGGAGVRAGATGDYWGDLGAQFGDIRGGIAARPIRKAWLDYMKTQSQTPVQPGGTKPPPTDTFGINMTPITPEDILNRAYRKKRYGLSSLTLSGR